MEFIVTIPNDAHAVFELMHFCRTRNIEMRPYRKKAAAGVRVPNQPPASVMNPPSPIRKAILQALKQGAIKKYDIYDKLPEFTKQSINASLWTNRETGWVSLKYNKYVLTPAGKAELARLEKKG